MLHIVYDSAALLAYAGANKSAAALMVEGAEANGPALWTPLLCVLDADGQRPGIAQMVGRLRVLNLIAMDYDTVLAVTALREHGLRDSAACALYCAQPSADRPEGALIATTAPELYTGTGARTLDLNT
jgi:hypothetical protein